MLGRIIARNVDVGDLVEKGQAIARIDPLPYQLAVRAAAADLATAKSQLEKASAQRDRTRMLVEKKASPQADLDIAQAAMDTAAASVRQAAAQLAKAKEQLSYTTLTADIDGVVTSVDAEVGQIKATGGETDEPLARLTLRNRPRAPDGCWRAACASSPRSARVREKTPVGGSGGTKGW